MSTGSHLTRCARESGLPAVHIKAYKKLPRHEKDDARGSLLF